MKIVIILATLFVIVASWSNHELNDYRKGEYFTILGIMVVGLFLMASAVGLENLEPTSPKPIAEKTLLVHGWNDDVVPVENAINFARNYQVQLYLLPSDHRLITQLDSVANIFQNFLQQCLESQKKGDPRSQWEKEQEAKFQKETFKQIQPRIPR